MVEENQSQEFRLKNIDETRNYFIEEIKQNELINKNSRKIYATLNHIEQILNPYFSFYNCWMYFNFCFCFFD